MKIYLYAFNMYAGFDKVFILNKNNNNFKAGDLIQNGEGYHFLVLGKNISFEEVYNTVYSSDINFTKTYSGLFSESTINLIHWMVYKRYSTYKNVIKFFLDTEIENLLTKEIKTNKKQKAYSINIGEINIKGNGGYQTLIVFPDIRSFKNIIGNNFNEGIFLYSLDTQNTKNKNRWNIKTGNEALIYSTSSEIFHDYKNLKEIYFIEPQKWYYAAQQDPRYKVGTVLEKIAENNNAKITIINSEEIFKN